MTAGANAILTLSTPAPVFVDIVEDPAAIAEAIRKFGLPSSRPRWETCARPRARRAADAVRGAQRLGQLAAAGALHEGFARAALEEAASACGLIRDDGLRAVKSAIAAGLSSAKSSRAI